MTPLVGAEDRVGGHDSGERAAPTDRRPISGFSAMTDAERGERDHAGSQQDPVAGDQHAVQVGRRAVVRAVLARGEQVEATAAEAHGTRVQQVDVDHPLAERLQRHEHECHQGVAPARCPAVTRAAMAAASAAPMIQGEGWVTNSLKQSRSVRRPPGSRAMIASRCREVIPGSPSHGANANACAGGEGTVRKWPARSGRGIPTWLARAAAAACAATLLALIACAPGAPRRASTRPARSRSPGPTRRP